MILFSWPFLPLGDCDPARGRRERQRPDPLRTLVADSVSDRDFASI